MTYYIAAVIRKPENAFTPTGPLAGIFPLGKVTIEGMPESFAGIMFAFTDPDDAAEWGEGAYIPIGERKGEEKGALL